MLNLGKVVVTGAAGLVGQNLIQRLIRSGVREIVGIDKHAHNAAILARLHPAVDVVVADLAEDSGWKTKLTGCRTLVVGHAQIGGLNSWEFVRNNVIATERLMEAATAVSIPYIVNISSSVVNSMAVDHYTESKKAQEKVVFDSGIPQVILRPTLMFGWFDRKHLGWLARFLEKTPIFPIPGSGRYTRQPLYAGDFCDIIVASVKRRIEGAYNITGQERIDYIDLIRALRAATGSRAAIVRVPYGAFWLMLKGYGFVDSNPPFTTRQLRALVTPDLFEIIDWPSIFGVQPTPLREALGETFGHPEYSRIALQF